ncbi:helix-turn-helix transcriptional regulator [Nocardia sp. IFM 10818]
MTRRKLRGFTPARLAAAIETSGMRRDEIARLADVTTQTLTNWLTGTSTPAVDKLAAVVGVLGLSMRDVLDIDPTRASLADLRVLAGLTQGQLATATGLGEETVGQLERGNARLLDRHAGPLATALAVSVLRVRAAHDIARNRPPAPRPDKSGAHAARPRPATADTRSMCKNLMGTSAGCARAEST